MTTRSDTTQADTTQGPDTLQGRVAIVTGAASPIGMGRSITSALGAGRGPGSDAGHSTKTGWNKRPTTCGNWAAMTQWSQLSPMSPAPGSAADAVSRTVSELGGLHILVNNAGISPRTGGFVSSDPAGGRTDFWDIEPDAWKRVIDVNLSGPFVMVPPPWPGTCWSKGSAASLALPPAWTPCGEKAAPLTAPSKAGHEALVAIMAQDLEGSGVTANVVTPGGPTATNMVLHPGRRRDRLLDSAGGYAVAGGLDCLECRQRLERPSHHRLLLGRLAATRGTLGKVQRPRGLAPTGHTIGPSQLVPAAGKFKSPLPPGSLLASLAKGATPPMLRRPLPPELLRC